MIQIDKGIPQPAAKIGAKRYPWDEMQVGDSFFAPGMKKASLSSSATIQGKSRGKRFVPHAVTENGVDGVRVWRVE